MFAGCLQIIRVRWQIIWVRGPRCSQLIWAENGAVCGSGRGCLRVATARHGPKGGQSGRGAQCSPRADDALPADRRGLSPSGVVRVRNVVSPSVPIRSVEGDPRGSTGGRVGKGGRSKRRPVCNGSDRGSSFAPPRKGADFRRVLNHEKSAERLNPRGYLDDERHRRH
jgi:hypothetical protein